MSSAITANRFRLTVIMVIVIVMALGSAWLSLVMKKSAADAARAEERTEPDYIVENFSYVRMTPKGQAKYRLVGDKLTHNPPDDSFLVDRPVMTSVGKQGQKQTTVADRAVVVDDNTKVHMYGNVVVDRPAFGTTEAFHMTTDYLLVYPDEEIMQTPEKVAIHKGGAILTGTGMFANNVTREMQIFGETKVFYPPTQQPPGQEKKGQ